MSKAPFRRKTTKAYVKSGLGMPFPLGHKRKGPPPNLTTGHNGEITQDKIDEWVSSGEYVTWSTSAPDEEHRQHVGNIGLRIAEDVLVLDIDAYEKGTTVKTGDASRAALEESLGDLPATYVNTARDYDGGAGHRFYAVEPNVAQAARESRFGTGIDILTHRHRYAVVSPSVHPDTNTVYSWYDESGDVTGPPNRDDLAELPEAWQEWILSGKRAPSAPDLSFTAYGPAAYGDNEYGTTHEDAVQYALDTMNGLTGDGRQPIMRDVVYRLVGAGREDLVDVLREEWIDVMGKERKSRAKAKAEFKRAYEGAVEKVSPVPETQNMEGLSVEAAEVSDEAEFPAHLLGSKLQAYVTEVARAKQVPLGLAGPSALSALSAATCNGIVAEAFDGYEYGLAVWFVGIAASSERKTSTTGEVITKPFSRVFSTIGDRHADERHKLTAVIKIYEKDYRKYTTTKDADADMAATIAADLEVAQVELARITPPSFLATDATSQAMSQVMERNYGTCYMVDSEGGMISMFAGRYNNAAADTDLASDAWSRNAVVVHRVSRDSVVIDQTHLVLAQLVQENVAKRLNDPDMEGSGFLSRMWFTNPPSKVGTRQYKVDPMDKRTAAWWDSVLTKLVDRGWANDTTPDSLQMDEDADRAVHAFFVKCESKEGDYHAGVTRNQIGGWWGKAPEMAVRAAALMELAEDPHTDVIHADTVERAITLIDYFGREAERFYIGVISPFLGSHLDTLRGRITRYLASHIDVGEVITAAALLDRTKSGHDRTGYTPSDAYTVCEALEQENMLEDATTKATRATSFPFRYLGVLPNQGDLPPTEGPLVGVEKSRNPNEVTKKSVTRGNRGIHTGTRNNIPSSSSLYDMRASGPLSPAEGPPYPDYPVQGDEGDVAVSPGDTVTWEFDGEDLPIHVYSEDRKREFLAFLGDNPVLGFDTETTGLRTFSGDVPRLAQFASEDEAWVIVTDLYPEAVVAAFTIGQKFYAHNAGFDNLVVAEHLGISQYVLDDKVTDTQMLSHLVDPRGQKDGGTGHGLKALSDVYLAAGASDSDKELRDEAKRLKIKVGDRFADIPIDNRKYITYAGADAILVRRLGPYLETLLNMRQIHQVNSIIPDGVEYTSELELVLLREERIAVVAQGMKRRGIKVDRTAADHLHADLAQAEETAMIELAEHGVDSPNKNAQVAAAIEAEGEYKLTEKTGGGALSVASHILDAAVAGGSEVARLVGDAKKFKRYRTVYVDGLLEYTDSSDVLHPDIAALRAVTGRWSISNPPLQQIPADMHAVRELFVPSKDDYRIVSADFSQIEARVLAALAGDDVFYEDVVHGVTEDGTDIHSQTARIAFGDEFTPAERTMAKRIVFGVLYGGGVAALAKGAGVDMDTAGKVFDAFNTKYKGVQTYAKHLENVAKKDDGFFLPSGRYAAIGGQGSYRAANYMIQGTARDLFVDAVLRLVDAGYGHALLLPMHDEVLLELPSKGIGAETSKIAGIMATTFGGVEMTVGAGYGKTWADADHG